MSKTLLRQWVASCSRTLGKYAYPTCESCQNHILDIACLQHVKRDFIDCGKEDKDAQEVVDILNRFYREDKKHNVGVNGWTVEDHLAYRQSYACLLYTSHITCYRRTDF